jgi:xylan 1,4-beta-xylosidase
MIKYRNPVIPGFFPDPSICRAGNDFFIVNSSFEFFPGVPISHSKDLVHWELAGYCITRNDQLTYETGHQNNTGIFAPSIRYHNGIFYMVTTNVSVSKNNSGNFFVWTKDPYGQWSAPVFLDTPGIDPSFFFDDDGTSFYLGTSENVIYMHQIDIEKGKISGPRIDLWAGTGGCYPEGPHLYKKNGWYYLLISEGGTERCHMLTMARSRNRQGPYESCPHNPVLTNRSLGLPVQSVGHGDLVQDQNGDWWAVCLGTRTFSYPPRHNLGRETMLVPVDWSGEWPVFGDNGRVLDEFTVPRLPCRPEETKDSGSADFFDAFTSKKLDLSWNFIYNPDNSLWKTGSGVLILHGNEKRLQDTAPIAWIGRRQQHHKSRTEVTLSFSCCEEGEEAGLSIFMNNRHHYEAFLAWNNGRRCLIFRRQIGSLEKNEAVIYWPADTVTLLLDSDFENYIFSYKTQNGTYKELGCGEVQYLTTETGGHFTGNYIALYSVGNGKRCCTSASFMQFLYRGK